jgi:hypothetical protein
MAKDICTELVSILTQGGWRGTYVEDTKNDTHLHLQRVGEDEGVVGSVPGWVDTEGVAVDRLDTLDDVADLEVGGPSELRLGEDEREGEDVVVHETGVHGEHAHEEDDVATVEEGVEDLATEGQYSLIIQRRWNSPRFRIPS